MIENLDHRVIEARLENGQFKIVSDYGWAKITSIVYGLSEAYPGHILEELAAEVNARVKARIPPVEVIVPERERWQPKLTPDPRPPKKNSRPEKRRNIKADAKRRQYNKSGFSKPTFAY